MMTKTDSILAIDAERAVSRLSSNQVIRSFVPKCVLMSGSADAGRLPDQLVIWVFVITLFHHNRSNGAAGEHGKYDAK